jgi:protein-L-isoaspartate(D-aspartate) O-methyltransferase
MGDHWHKNDRERMLQHDLRGRGISDPAVLQALAEIPREKFVPPTDRWRAYADGPLPIGEGQTISQPYIVALMTQVLRVYRECEVLEIGTGSGYQTAILARLARRVFTIERSAKLSATAQSNLSKLGIDNVEFRVGDGSCGWPEERQFDRIMITAAVPDFPQPLVAQLAEMGVIVSMPVQYLKGVGPARAAVFEKLGVRTWPICWSIFRGTGSLRRAGSRSAR